MVIKNGTYYIDYLRFRVIKKEFDIILFLNSLKKKTIIKLTAYNYHQTR